MSETAKGTSERADFSLFDLWLVVWRGKWIVVCVVALFAALSVAYALTATKWYQAHAVLMYAEQSSNPLSGSLGGLAALANVGGFDAGSGRDEALAILRSRDFAAEFIEANDLLDAFAGFGGEPSEGESDMRDAVRFFHENVLRVQEDRTTGRVTLSMFWTDGQTAATWASTAIELINERMRQRALREAQSNIEFLKEQLAENNLLSLQQSIGNLIETELQSLMLAQGNRDFAFRVIDPAQPPKRRSKPRRTLIVASAVIVGGVVALFIVFIRDALRARNT